MDIQDEATLRIQAGRLALEWNQARQGDFTGDHPTAYVPLIEAAAVVADEAKLTLGRWVRAGRRGGLSWSEIGQIVGVSKQAAQQRFGVDETDEAAPGVITVALGATAFNEVAILKREGAAGRELVALGALRLFFRQTDYPWLHLRTVGELDPGRRLAEGWEAVATWFIFNYYKRRA